jgi:uncharacterized SAM-binding protein YcdF (DUF218 family)
LARGRQPGSAHQGAVGGRRRLWLVVLLALVIVGVACHVLRQPLLSRLGRTLVVADPLEKADAALVLAGDGRYRVRAAAHLYRQGWVRKVVLSGAQGPFGVYETEFSVPFAVSQGISRSDILPIPNTTRFIDQEAELLVKVAEGQGIRSLYVVTTSYEARRARRVFQRIAGGRLRVLVYPARDEAFDLDRWWQSRQGRKAILMEWLGLNGRD